MSKATNNINPADRPWIEHSVNPDHPVVFLDTDAKGWLESDGGAGGQINTVEVSIVQNIVHSLSVCGVEPSSIGVITPFRSQVRFSSIVSEFSGATILSVTYRQHNIIPLFDFQLRALDENNTLREFKSNGLEICTIDRFQGRDKPAIILSLVRSNNEGKVGRLLQDFRRLNVAFSRAKRKMIIIGSFTTLCKGSDVMGAVLKSLQERNWVYKMPGS